MLAVPQNAFEHEDEFGRGNSEGAVSANAGQRWPSGEELYPGWELPSFESHGRSVLGRINPTPNMRTKYLVISLLAAALPMAALIAQDSGKDETTPKEEQNSGMTGKDQMMCKHWSQQDSELDRLVTEMNNAALDKKVDAIAAVVAKLVEQQKAAHEQMTKMMSADTKTEMNMCRMMCMDMKGAEQSENGDEHQHHH